ncbi:hypothetical protein [Falsiroseomonas tokyonensis]|uniref:UrcA family protein n=1 Tax=Falsiroseomonas tokyonensis TaxID=430521 RepID=A0ABV7BTW0_9PROT|nr:hypothetical protein [Falsiroseomonas tokyonensis]MBU8538948.1 hypothetical protein [Falsiroseomonas tokyonensis]
MATPCPDAVAGRIMRSMQLPVFLLVLVLCLSMGPLRLRADMPLRVTSDSTSYCRELAGRLSALPPPRPARERRVVEEGLRLCESGHVRTGIARLRRALRDAPAAQ